MSLLDTENVHFSANQGFSPDSFILLVYHFKPFIFRKQSLWLTIIIRLFQTISNNVFGFNLGFFVLVLRSSLSKTSKVNVVHRCTSHLLI